MGRAEDAAFESEDDDPFMIDGIPIIYVPSYNYGYPIPPHPHESRIMRPYPRDMDLLTGPAPPIHPPPIKVGEKIVADPENLVTGSTKKYLLLACDDQRKYLTENQILTSIKSAFERRAAGRSTKPTVVMDDVANPGSSGGVTASTGIKADQMTQGSFQFRAPRILASQLDP